MRTVAVLGASGFIGTSVLNRLAAHGDYSITAFARERPARGRALHLAASSVTWATLDLTHNEVEITGLAPFDVLIDCTGMVNVRDFGAAPNFYEFVENQLRWIDRFCKFGCQTVIGLSSGGTIYGNAAALPISEAAPANPNSDYGKSKLAYEQGLLRIADARGLDMACIFRVSNACGSGQRLVGGFGLIPTVTHALFTGGSIKVWGNGTALRDYIDVADIADAIVLAALAKPGRTVLNLGSGVGRSTNDVIAALAAICGREPVIERMPQLADMIGNNVLDISRASSVLGWSPRVPFARSLASFVQNYRLPDAGSNVGQRA